MNKIASELTYSYSSQQMLDYLSKVEKIYNITAEINPETTAIITFKGMMPEALKYYSRKCRNKSKLPSFILVDHDASSMQDISFDELIAEYKIDILPIQNIHKIPQKIFCLYTRSEAESFEGQYGIQKLINICAKNNIKNGFFVNISVFRKLCLPSPVVDYASSRMDDIIRIYSMLQDDLSREYFLRSLRYLATGETGYLTTSAYPQYEHPEVMAQEGDSIIEGGLCLGDTTLNFLKQIGSSGHIYAFEPLKKFYDIVQEKTYNYPNATIEHYGLFSKAIQFYIEDHGGGSYLVDKPNPNAEKCQCISIDSYVHENNIKCDLIKLDIEGTEISCLLGAENTINKFMPKLQISLYHSPHHYLDIPLMILDKYPDYQLYIGHHSFWSWETMLYAIKR